MTPSPLDRLRGTLPGMISPAIIEGPAAALLALLGQLDRSQWYPAEELRTRQFAQLKQLAPWLAAHSPAFARRLKDAGLAADALATPEGFAALPVVARRWYREHADIDCKRVPEGHGPLGSTNTSGSTGEYLRVQRTRPNQLIWMAMVLRDQLWHGADFTTRLATIRAPNLPLKHRESWGLPASLLFETGPALALPISIPGDELFEHLRAFGVGTLMVYPNALRLVLDAAETRGERLEGLKTIQTIAEIVDDGLRERTRRVFGVEITDTYSCQEAGYLALQCPESGLYHLMAEAAVVEVLRPDGTPCADGETGTVVITDLHNFATPVVRYALGDVAEAAGPCPCGRGLPTIRRIVGRNRNFVRMPDGTRIWPSMGGLGPGGFLHELPILQSQFIQIEAERIEARFVVERPLTQAEEQLIVERAQGTLGYPFMIEIHYFEGRLPLPESGKFEEYICLV